MPNDKHSILVIGAPNPAIFLALRQQKQIPCIPEHGTEKRRSIDDILISMAFEDEKNKNGSEIHFELLTRDSFMDTVKVRRDLGPTKDHRPISNHANEKPTKNTRSVRPGMYVRSRGRSR